MRFPILYRGAAARIERNANPHWPVDVPWGLVAPSAARARAWYGSSLERLADHGGLTAAEILALINGDDINANAAMSLSEAVTALCEAATQWEAAQKGGQS